MRVACESIGRLSFRPADEVPLLRFPGLSETPGVSHAITTRVGGVSRPPYDRLNLSTAAGDDPAAVNRNRRLAHAATGIRPGRLVSCSQVGGNDVAVAWEPGETTPARADAIVSATPGLFLAMTFADCLPIILADASVPAVGLVHAGWRGTVGLVALHAWQALAGLGARPETTCAYLGPAIGPCCYEVGEDVAVLALRLGSPAAGSLESRQGRAYLDLAGINAAVLEDLGVAVQRSDVCTACNRHLLYSYRAAQGRTGRFAVYVGVTP